MYFEIRKGILKSKNLEYVESAEELNTDYDKLDILGMLDRDDEELFGDLDEN